MHSLRTHPNMILDPRGGIIASVSGLMTTESEPRDREVPGIFLGDHFTRPQKPRTHKIRRPNEAKAFFTETRPSLGRPRLWRNANFHATLSRERAFQWTSHLSPSLARIGRSASNIVSAARSLPRSVKWTISVKIVVPDTMIPGVMSISGAPLSFARSLTIRSWAALAAMMSSIG